MVERFHRQLKTAIKCHQTETEAVPVILIGIRTTWKENLKATSAELFGDSIPGQFFEESIEDFPSQDNFLQELRQTIQNLQSKIKRHDQRQIFVYKDLDSNPCIFQARHTD